MKVLIADFNLYATVGGGQTVYRSLIAKNPGIQFTYLLRAGAVHDSANAPANVRAVKLPKRYHLRAAPGEAASAKEWSVASNIAFAVSGEEFDIVESPDYHPMGAFVPAALTAHDVQFGKYVLAMHGVVSHPKLNAWHPGAAPDENTADLIVIQKLEEMQYRTADVRYGISQTYINEWQEKTGSPALYLCPLKFKDVPKLAPIPRCDGSREGACRPDLVFIGRLDSNKGPDLFIDLVSLLPKDSYGRVHVCGPDSKLTAQGLTAIQYLRWIAENRSTDVDFAGPLQPDQVMRLFGGRNVTCLPSRWDPFNLVAFESLLSGCPTVIDSSCGACSFFDTYFPNIPYVKIHHASLHEAALALEELLRSYDQRRRQLHAAVQSADFSFADAMPDLRSIYAAAPTPHSNIRDEYFAIYEGMHAAYKQERLQLKGVRARFVSRFPDPLRHKVYAWRTRPLAMLKNTISTGALTATGDFELVRQLQQAREIAGDYANALALPEKTEAEVELKIEALSAFSERLLLDRARLWRELGRLEACRGNAMVAATYALRGMRLLGRDTWGECEVVASSLEELGFAPEAQAVRAMYGGTEGTGDEAARYGFLEAAYERNLRSAAASDYEILDRDRAPESLKPRISIIVSLYNAAAKLPRFLLALNNQTLAVSGAFEVVLVDSGSPTSERSVFLEMAGKLKYPVVYARSQERETIQRAWNRGIDLARGEYLAFLGVDEIVTPDCYEILSRELDCDYALDWVIGSSVITEVTPEGSYLRDAMIYDRTGYAQHLVSLETCWLSWVGALYRKSIHTRFGYYDVSFRAAGDTEFKGRVLPHIKTKAIPRTLGTFWNYPDERTTAHPRAEIEDLRAWYLHRTDAGMRYAFENQPAHEVNTLLRACRGYRKSYMERTSTDCDLAGSVLAYARSYRTHDLPSRDWHVSISNALNAYRRLDYIEPLTSIAATRALVAAARASRRLKQPGRESTGVFHDNRYEQHHWVWRQ